VFHSIVYGEGSQIVKIHSKSLFTVDYEVMIPDSGMPKYFLTAQSASNKKIYVPSAITLTGARASLGNTVAIFMYTDIWYFGDYERSYHDINFAIRCNNGRGEIRGF
jgi:hypothetical protein